MKFEMERTCPTCNKTKHYFWFVENGVKKVVDAVNVVYYCSEECATVGEL